MKPNGLDLSIVIATRGEREFFTACLDSLILNTTGLTYEVLIVTPRDRWNDKWTRPRVFHVVEPDNYLGSTAAFCLGFRQARGKHIVWMSDDVITYPNWASRAIYQLESYSPLVSVVTFAWYNEGELRVDGWHNLPGANISLTYRDYLASMDYWDSSYKNYHQDTDFAMRVYQSGHLILPSYDSPLIHVIVHDSTRDAVGETYNSDRHLWNQRWLKYKAIARCNGVYSIRNSRRGIDRLERLVLE